MCKNMHNMLVI